MTLPLRPGRRCKYHSACGGWSWGIGDRYRRKRVHLKFWSVVRDLPIPFPRCLERSPDDAHCCASGDRRWNGDATSFLGICRYGVSFLLF